MAKVVSTLIGRVGRSLDSHAPWFSAVAAWYDHAQWTKKIALETVVPKGEPCQVNLSVNGTIFEDREATRSDASLAWRVVPSQLKRGANELYLWIDREENRPWHFGTISVEHAESLSEEQRQKPPRPMNAQQVSVAARFDRDFRPGADRWTVDLLDDALKFRVHVEDRLPALELVIGFPQVGIGLNLEALWEEIEEALGKKIEQLLREKEKVGRKSADDLQEEIDDLKAYRKLHRKHLAEAVRSAETVTLQEIMAKTEPVDQLIQRQRPAKPAPVKGSFLGKFLTFVVLLGAVGFVAWTSGWIPEPVVSRIRNGWNDLVQQFRNAQPGNGQPGNAEDRRNALRIDERGGKSGDVQISLLWNNKNDLDLHVESPSKEMIYFGNKTSKCGGQLDVDDNVSYLTAKLQPVENTYWPTGKAPKGSYKIFVNYFANHHQPDCQDPTDFTVRLVVKGQVQNFRGQLREDAKERKILVHEFTLE